MATPIPLELTDDLSTQPVQIITGAQTIYAYNAENHNNYPVFIKFYDKLAANVNPAVDAPAYTLTVPTATLIGPGRLINDSVALTFTTAITIRGTVNAANNDTTSPAASPALAIMLDQVTAGLGGGDALTTSPLSQFAPTTSAQLAGVLSDETGSGAAVFATTPTLVTPILGTPTSGNLSNCTALPIAGLAASTATALGVGSIELGNASDTTIARASAGVASIEGVNIVTTSSTDTLTNKTLTSPTLTTPALGTPASGTLTSCTGLPVAGIAASTVTALGVGSVEVGHASDTTIARVSAGKVSVEGVNVVTTSSTDTLTNKTIDLTNSTSLPISTGVSGLGTGVATLLATPSSANLAAALTDETGTGFAVFSASPALTSTPTAPTAAVDTSSTQLATTAFVIGQASAVADSTPAMDGTAARGASTHYARANHVHPTDTSRAPLASPTFTGTPAAPTATLGDNTTQLANTAFVTTAVAAGAGTAGGDLSGTYPSPSVVSTGGVAFAASATIDTTQAVNISGVFPLTQLGFSRQHVTETATITLALGDGVDKDSTASGTLNTILFSGSPSETYPHSARIRLVVTSGPQTVTIPTSRRLGSANGTITTIQLNNGNHELSWIAQPSGVAGALEYWFADSADDSRQAFSNTIVTVGTGIRQLAQIGTMTGSRVVTLPTASAYISGTGFWVTDESGTVTPTNKLILTALGGETVNGIATRDVTVGFAEVFVQSDGSTKWTINPDVSVSAGVSDVAYANTWNGVTATAPSKNAVYDQLHLIDTTDTGKVTTLNCAAGIVNTNSGGTVQSAIATSGSGNVILDTGATLTTPTVAAGGTSRAPVRLSSGTVATSPVAGDIEYDGKAFYATHATSERGLVPSMECIGLTAAYTLLNQTAAQPMFTATSQVTVAGNTTYRFTCFYSLSSLSASTGSFGFAVGGTAVLSAVTWMWVAAKQALNTQTGTVITGFNNTASNGIFTPQNTQTNAWAKIDGMLRITTAGTIIPQVSLGVAAAATVNAGSFFEIWSTGSDSVTTVGNWS